MNVQQNLNIMRKIALNLAREYKNRFEPRKAINGVLKRNMFDINDLVKFIDCFIALIDVTVLLPNQIDAKLSQVYLAFINQMVYNKKYISGDGS